MGQSARAIERARVDLAEDRPWKARERLRSYLTAHPTDQPARELLGEVEWTMRNVPAAGAAWFLTERDDPRAREAIALLRAEHRGRPRKLTGALDVSDRLVLVEPLDDWPAAVQSRLRELRRATAAERMPVPGLSPRESAMLHDGGLTPLDRVGLYGWTPSGLLGAGGCLLALVLSVVAAAVGLVTIVGWIF